MTDQEHVAAVKAAEEALNAALLAAAKSGLTVKLHIAQFAHIAGVGASDAIDTEFFRRVDEGGRRVFDAA